jgi:putative ABC transport system permease protein
MPVTVVDSLYLKLGGVKLLSGRLINDDEIDGVIISTSVAQIFGKTAEEIIGKSMKFTFFITKAENGEKSIGEIREKYETGNDFKIIGVTDSTESVIFVNAKALPGIDVSDFSQVKVKCAESEAMGNVRTQISDRGFFVSSLSETVEQANKIFRIIKLVLMLFGIIALIVSAIGMFNTMTITLLERTEEIGIMKSIGASDGTISLLFIMESTIMGFLGGLAGIIIGWLEGETFNLLVNLIAVRFGGEKVDLFYSPFWFVASIIIFSAFVGFLTGVIPARRASRIDPLEALRYK